MEVYRKDVRTMSYVVARMQKMKAENLTGIGNHNQRKTQNHSNEDIDVERSHLNYDLVSRTENYKTDIEKFINENKTTERAIRKDAVLINEWIISSDKDFFENKDDKEIERFFEVAKNYFAEKFGDENIRYAQVHLDENTPHMHLGIVPFDNENKLSAKRIFNRAALLEIQDELPKTMQKLGFDIQRGEKGSERKNLTVPEYKIMKDELKKLDETLEKKSESMKMLLETTAKVEVKSLDIRYELEKVEVETDEKNLFGKPKTEIINKRTGNLIIPKEKFEGLINYVNDNATVKQAMVAYVKTDLVLENESLKEENQALKIENSELKQRNNRLEEKVNILKNRVLSLKNEIKTIYQTLKSTFKRSVDEPGVIKSVMSKISLEVENEHSNSEIARLDKEENRVRNRTRGRSR